MATKFGKINLEGFIDSDEEFVMNNYNDEELYNYLFKKIVNNNQIWTLASAGKEVFMPSFDGKTACLPIFPSQGFAKAVRQTLLAEPLNKPGVPVLADTLPKAYSIDNFTDDLIKLLDNNKPKGLNLILYTYTSAREITTKEFLARIAKYN